MVNDLAQENEYPFKMKEQLKQKHVSDTSRDNLLEMNKKLYSENLEVLQQQMYTKNRSKKKHKWRVFFD